MEHGSDRDGRRATWSAAAGFLALLLVAFWPVAVGRRSFFHMDLCYEHLPVWEVTQKALAAGDSPFWLEGEYCGHPPLFIQEVPLFYPLTAPLLWTGAPVHRLADLFTLFHLWLAAFAAYLLVRDLTARPEAGLFAGAGWTLSARMIQTAIWPNAVAVAALLPLLAFGLVRIASGRRRSGVMVTAVAGGLAICTARPQSLLAAAPLLGCVAVALVAAAPRRRQAALDLLLAATLALALGAPSWLPSAFLLPETTRSQGLSADAEDLQPLAHGHELDMVFLPVDGRTRWPESAAYPGLLVYALALSAIFVRPGRDTPLARALLAGSALGGLAGLALAFGDAGPYRWIGRLPVVRGFRVPERFLLSWSLALVLAASLALAHWLARARRPHAVAALVLLGLAADLVPHAWRAAPTAEAAVYAVEPAIVPEVRARLGTDEAGFPNRYISLAASLNVAPYPDPARLSLLREAGALKGTLGMRYGLESAYGAGPALARVEGLLRRPTERALSLAGVGIMVLSGRDRNGALSPLVPPILRADSPLPRALLAPEAIVVPEDQAIRVAISPKLDPRRTAVLEDGPPLRADPAWRKETSAVRLIERRPARLALETKASVPAVLVLFESFEKGWRATVDGSDAPVLRADGAFRAVRLSAGTHRVEFVYVPPGLREGLGLGLAGFLGLALASLRIRDVDSGEAAPRGL
jgi:Bacterial membrane protein YfhO